MSRRSNLNKNEMYYRNNTGGHINYVSYNLQHANQNYENGHGSYNYYPGNYKSYNHYESIHKNFIPALLEVIWL